MARVPREADAQRALILLSGTFVTVVVVVALYWARSVFIPLALAVFLTFVLSPFVLLLQRRGLGRIPAALVVVTAAALVLGGVGWVVTQQIARLGGELPEYTENLKAKVESIRDLTGSNGRLGKLVDDLAAAFKGKPAGPEQAGADAARPTPVTVEPDTPPWLTHIPSFLSPVVEFLGQGALAIVLVVFMLLKREDLRNRFIRLVGRGRMTVTTKAVDDAAHRVSRFLLAQAVVNGSYGVALTVGLMVIGVPLAFLWGFFAAVLRYIPYVGAWIAAIFPVTLSVAAAPGWAQPLYVLGLVLVLELLSNNWMEPWLYGQSMGVSEVAQLVSAAFWAFLWGPIGMVLSGPLPPGGLAHTRYLCKRLRARFPELKIVVGRWGLKSRVEENQEALKEAGADSMETSLLGTVRALQAFQPMLTQQQVPGHGPARAQLAASAN